MIYKMRTGEPIEINVVPLGFFPKDLSKQTKTIDRASNAPKTHLTPHKLHLEVYASAL